MYETRELFNPDKTAALYERSGIRRPEGCDHYIAVFEDGRPVAAAGIKGSILMGFAVEKSRQGEGLSALLCTELIRIGSDTGVETFYIFTKPERAFLFAACGFRMIGCTGCTALLEWGACSVEDFAGQLRKVSDDKPSGAACIVMNGNPFTLGHRHLAVRAAWENPWVYVIVVEEDASEFPYRIRLELIREGLKDLQNVTVLGGSHYVISHLTFPDYFLKDKDIGEARAEMDLELFCSHIAPALKISRRYVGQEPYCAVTASYNREMKRILPQRGIELVEIPRRESDGLAISAGEVRALLRNGKTEDAKRLLPPVTVQFLDTSEGYEVIKALRNK